MDLLLVTHTFLWWAEGSTKLSNIALASIQDQSNSIYLSDVSVWEIQIKAQLGKIQLQLPLRQLVEDHIANGIKTLPISTEHILEVGTLPPLHKDPFDRLLVAQARIEAFLLVTRDPAITSYKVRTLW